MRRISSNSQSFKVEPTNSANPAVNMDLFKTLPLGRKRVKLSKQAWWAPVVRFGVHVVVGSMIFVLISLPAFGLGLLVQYLANQGTAPYVVQVLTLLEYAIVTIDAVAFLAYLAITGVNAVKGMTE